MQHTPALRFFTALGVVTGLGLAIPVRPARAVELTPYEAAAGRDALMDVVETTQAVTRDLDTLTVHAATASLDAEDAAARMEGLRPGSREYAIALNEQREAEERLMSTLFEDMGVLAPRIHDAEKDARRAVVGLLQDPRVYRSMLTAYLKGEQTPALLTLAAYARIVKLRREMDQVQAVIVSAYLKNELDKVREAWELVQQVSDIDLTPESIDEVLDEMETDQGLDLGGEPIDALDALIQ